MAFAQETREAQRAGALEGWRTSARLDLGPASLNAGEVLAGPMRVGVGTGWGAMLGSYVVPWLVFAAVPGSVIPNGFAKVELLRRGPWSAAVQSKFFYIKLDDLDGDGINARGWVWPSRGFLEYDWNQTSASVLELSGILVRSTGEVPADDDISVEGVVLASNAHVGWIQRYRWNSTLTSWARVRVLLDRTPARADAGGTLDERARFRVRAQANVAEDASGVSATLGGLATFGNFNVRWGVGYGTWFLPWIDMPVGEDTVIADLDVYWRF